MKICHLLHENGTIKVIDAETQEDLIVLTNVKLPFVHSVKQKVEARTVPPNLITIGEVSNLLNLSPGTIRQLAQRNEIPSSVSIDGRRYWERVEIISLARKLDEAKARYSQTLTLGDSNDSKL